VPISLDDLIDDVRGTVRAKLEGDNTNPSESVDVTEALAQLLGFAWAVERLLVQAAGTKSTIPGHALSVRGYVDQVLSGEGRDAARERLTSYFKEAIRLLATQRLAVEQHLEGFRERIASAFRPSRIEDETGVGIVFRALGLKEVAYWREYQRRWRSIDKQGVEQVVQNEPGAFDAPARDAIEQEG